MKKVITVIGFLLGGYIIGSVFGFFRFGGIPKAYVRKK